MFGIRKLINILTKIHEELRIMSTVPAGLQALRTEVQALMQAVQSLIDVVKTSVAAIETAIADAGEDAQLSDVATALGQQIGNINAAVADLQTATNPATSTQAAALDAAHTAASEEAGQVTEAATSATDPVPVKEAPAPETGSADSQGATGQAPDQGQDGTAPSEPAAN